MPEGVHENQFPRRLSDTCGPETPLSWESAATDGAIDGANRGELPRDRMGRAFAMTIKDLGAGSACGDSVGVLADPFADAELVVDQDSQRAIDDLEILEFLAADLDPVPADPAFRERLAETLWEMVRDGRMARSRNH